MQCLQPHLLRSCYKPGNHPEQTPDVIHEPIVPLGYVLLLNCHFGALSNKNIKCYRQVMYIRKRFAI